MYLNANEQAFKDMGEISPAKYYLLYNYEVI